MKIEIKKGKNLSKKFIELFDKAKQKEFKHSSPIKDFSKYYNDIFFILKDKKKILSLGELKPLKINYLRKDYKIFGIANIVSLQKREGHGKKLIKSMIKYAKIKNKIIIGFCKKHNKRFYEKCGMKLNKQLLKRFLYKNSINKYEDYIIYSGGKDDFMKKLLTTKSKIKLNVPFW